MASINQLKNKFIKKSHPNLCVPIDMTQFWGILFDVIHWGIPSWTITLISL